MQGGQHRDSGAHWGAENTDKEQPVSPGPRQGGKERSRQERLRLHPVADT